MQPQPVLVLPGLRPATALSKAWFNRIKVKYENGKTKRVKLTDIIPLDMKVMASTLAELTKIAIPEKKQELVKATTQADSCLQLPKYQILKAVLPEYITQYKQQRLTPEWYTNCGVKWLTEGYLLNSMRVGMQLYDVNNLKVYTLTHINEDRHTITLNRGGKATTVPAHGIWFKYAVKQEER